MSPSPDRELLTQSAARELLERAGQIDSDSTSVETLRAAAREAGISEAAFEAALGEMRGQMVAPARVEPRRSRGPLAAAIATAAVMLAAMAFFIIPRAVGSSQSALYLDHNVRVECLPMKMAQDIAQTLLVDQDNEVQMSQGSRVLRVRATEAQVKTLTETFEASAKRLTSCDNTPPDA